MKLVKESMEADFDSGVWRAEEASGRTWQWWFWLFFIRGGDKPRQLMTLWSCKECDHIKVNDKDIFKSGLVERGEGEDLMNGAAATWYFNGSGMRHIIHPEKVRVRRGERKKLFTDDGRYLFSSEGKGFRVLGKEPEYDFRIKPSLNASPLKRVDYPLGLNFKIANIDRCELSGTLEGKEVEGTAYFQKVVCNAPATSWYWNITHFENGANFSYFKPVVGEQNFNFSDRHKGTLDLTLHKSCHLQLDKNKLFFPDFTLRREGGDLPTWKLKGRGEKGSIEVEIESYARACWRFQRPTARVSPVLHYNEYPCRVTKLDFNGGDITLEDLGEGLGNCEHAWGLLL